MYCLLENPIFHEPGKDYPVNNRENRARSYGISAYRQLPGLFLLTLFVNGFRYLLSSGGDGTDSAKKGIVNAIIGIVIVSFSYGIAVFIESTIKITVK